jgi:hypothetical protein
MSYMGRSEGGATDFADYTDTKIAKRTQSGTGRDGMKQDRQDGETKITKQTHGVSEGRKSNHGGNDPHIAVYDDFTKRSHFIFALARSSPVRREEGEDDHASRHDQGSGGGFGGRITKRTHLAEDRRFQDFRSQIVRTAWRRSQTSLQRFYQTNPSSLGRRISGSQLSMPNGGHRPPLQQFAKRTQSLGARVQGSKLSKITKRTHRVGGGQKDTASRAETPTMKTTKRTHALGAPVQSSRSKSSMFRKIPNEAT